MTGEAEIEVEGRRLRLTNLDKVMYPGTGFTKAQLVQYYVDVAPVLLRHLRGRPLTLKRYPDGVEGEFFYQKQCPARRPEWVGTVRVETKDHDVTYCLVEDLPTLVWLANLADLELHTSLSLASALSVPTCTVFDLDPGPPASILACARVALLLRDMFDDLNLRSYPKTSGSKGLQVYAPLNSPVSYEETKNFARTVAEVLAGDDPENVVATMAKEARSGKVFIDWSQNDAHKTTVTVYSLRAQPLPLVSTPLSWDEVETAVARADPALLTFDHEQTLERIGRLGDLFEPVLELRQSLPKLGKG